MGASNDDISWLQPDILVALVMFTSVIPWILLGLMYLLSTQLAVVFGDVVFAFTMIAIVIWFLLAIHRRTGLFAKTKMSTAVSHLSTPERLVDTGLPLTSDAPSMQLPGVNRLVVVLLATISWGWLVLIVGYSMGIII